LEPRKNNYSKSSNHINLKYRPDIDGLRAIAVLSVVIFHFLPKQLPGGFVGVDVFFVISGFLISRIILNHLKTNTFSFRDFYARRINRIFPALFTVLIVCKIFGWFALYPDEYQHLNLNILAGLTFISNFLLWSESGDYFDKTTIEKPLMHLWSLSIEEQFYIIWPLLLWVSSRYRFNFLHHFLFIAVTSFGLNIYLASADSIADFYSPLTRFWEFIAGAMIARINLYDQLKVNIFVFKHKTEIIARRLRSVTSIFGMLLILISLLFINPAMNFPSWVALLPVTGASFVIFAGPNAWINKTLLSCKLSIWLGRISYPLYLWHWPLLSFTLIIAEDNLSRKTRIIILIVSIILAWLTNLFIEQPFKKRRTSKNVKLFILATLLIITSSLATIFFQSDLQKTIKKKQQTINSQFNWDYEQNSQCLDNYAFKMANDFAWWFCTSDKPNPKALILGDSYANALYPMFIKENGIKNLGVLMLGACDFFDRGEKSNYSKVKNHPCTEKNYGQQIKFISNVLATEPSIKFVIIGGISKSPDNNYIDKMYVRLNYLTEMHKKIVIFLPHVKLNYDPRKCLARPLAHTHQNCKIDTKELEIFRKKYMPIIKKISSHYKNVFFFDPNMAFCDAKMCNFMSSGIPLLRDASGHFSEQGVNQLSISFIEWAQKEIPELLNEQ
jgi:peptidoglycan/LPS O-acetylase OafA/YrhL